MSLFEVKNFNGPFCEKLVSIKKGKKKDRGPTISAVTNIHTLLYSDPRISEYSGTRSSPIVRVMMNVLYVYCFKSVGSYKHKLSRIESLVIIGE